MNSRDLAKELAKKQNAAEDTRASGIVFSLYQTITGVILIGTGKSIPGAMFVSAGISGGVYAFKTTAKLFDGIEYIKKTVVGGLVGTAGVAFSWIGNGITAAFGGGAAAKITGDVADAILHDKDLPKAKELLQSGAIGALTGVVSFGAANAASGAADNIVKKLLDESDELTLAIARTAAGATSGGATAAVSKIVSNKFEGKPATNDVAEAVAIGAGIGGAIAATQQVSQAINKPVQPKEPAPPSKTEPVKNIPVNEKKPNESQEPPKTDAPIKPAATNIEENKPTNQSSRDKLKEQVIKHAPDHLNVLAQARNSELSYVDRIKIIADWFSRWDSIYTDYIVRGKVVTASEAAEAYAKGHTVTVKLRDGLGHRASTKEITVHGPKITAPEVTNTPLAAKAPVLETPIAPKTTTAVTPTPPETTTTTTSKTTTTPPQTSANQPSAPLILLPKKPDPAPKPSVVAQASKPAAQSFTKPTPPTANDKILNDQPVVKRFNPFEYTHLSGQGTDIIEKMLKHFCDFQQQRKVAVTDAKILYFINFWFSQMHKEYNFEVDGVFNPPGAYQHNPIYFEADEAAAAYLRGEKILLSPAWSGGDDYFVQGPIRVITPQAAVVVAQANPVVAAIVPQAMQVVNPIVALIAPPAAQAVNQVVAPVVQPPIAAKVAAHSHIMYKLIQEDKIIASVCSQAIKSFFQLELAIGEYSVTQRTKNGLFSRPFAELAHIISEIKKGNLSVAHGLAKIKKIAEGLGNKHPLIATVNKCTPFQYQDQQYKDASCAMKL